MVHTGTISSKPWAAVQWLEFPLTDTPTAADLAAAAAFIGNAYGSNIIAHMHNSVTHAHTKLSWYGVGEDIVEGEASFALSGSGVGTCCPANVCLAISWHVAIGYRGGHPRTYVPGVPINSTDFVSLVGGTFASTLAAGGNTFRTNVNGHTETSITSITLGTVSFVRNKNWRTPPVFVPFVNATVDLRLDSQRRRLGPDLA